MATLRAPSRAPRSSPTPAVSLPSCARATSSLDCRLETACPPVNIHPFLYGDLWMHPYFVFVFHIMVVKASVMRACLWFCFCALMQRLQCRCGYRSTAAAGRAAKRLFALSEAQESSEMIRRAQQPAPAQVPPTSIYRAAYECRVFFCFVCVVVCSRKSVRRAVGRRKPSR